MARVRPENIEGAPASAGAHLLHEAAQRAAGATEGLDEFLKHGGVRALFDAYFEPLGVEFDDLIAWLDEPVRAALERTVTTHDGRVGQVVGAVATAMVVALELDTGRLERLDA